MNNKRIKKEAPPWNGQQNILLEGLNLFKSTNLTLNSDVDQDTKMFGSHERFLPYGSFISKYIQIKIQKGAKTKIRTIKYIQLNTGFRITTQTDFKNRFKYIRP